MGRRDSQNTNNHKHIRSIVLYCRAWCSSEKRWAPQKIQKHKSATRSLSSDCTRIKWSLHLRSNGLSATTRCEGHCKELYTVTELGIDVAMSERTEYCGCELCTVTKLGFDVATSESLHLRSNGLSATTRCEGHCKELYTVTELGIDVASVIV